MKHWTLKRPKDHANIVEAQALRYLQQRNCKLIDKNFACPLGEIDLIVLDKTTVVFVEVRFRKDVGFGTAQESLTSSKQRRLTKTASIFLQHYPKWQHHPCRFDVVAAWHQTKDGTLGLEWIKNAFST